ncbi:phosphatidylserine synthase [Verrucomicrobiaceae bacterium R5-34]|nr:phosphatidylserine synthase [Verrucomicrobiaceae bacterium R5-34]
MTELVLNEAIHQRVIVELIPEARKYVWIVTADLKDMHVAKGRRFVPFLEVMSDLVQQGIAVRLFHAKEPGPRFRKDFDQYPALIDSDLFERILCPRIHTKAIVVDGTTAFIGSANLTGAGMGAKNPKRRNFEAGFLTDEKAHLDELLDWIDTLYLGDLCQQCQLREYCPDPIA